MVFSFLVKTRCGQTSALRGGTSRQIANMNTTQKLVHPALIDRDMQNGGRITLVGTPRKRYTPSHTILAADLVANPTIDRKAAWGLPAAPVKEILLNPDVCDIYPTENSIARHLGIRSVSASYSDYCREWKKEDSRMGWASALHGLLYRAGYRVKHGMPGLKLEQRRAIRIRNKCFALRNVGKWLVKDRACYWGGFDFSFESVHDTLEAAQKRAHYLNSHSRDCSSDCYQHSFSVHAGGSSKAFA